MYKHTQGDDDCHAHPIAYFRNFYRELKRELLAVLLSIEQFRSYIGGNKFTVITDHAILKWLLNLTSDLNCPMTTRLSQFNFEILHKSSSNVPDALTQVEIAATAECLKEILDLWYTKLFRDCQKPCFKYYKVENQVLYKSKENVDTIRDKHDVPTCVVILVHRKLFINYKCIVVA